MRPAQGKALHQLTCSLHCTLRPAELLGAEGADVLGELGGRHDVLAVDEAPAGHLRAVREIEILGQRVVLPAAALGDGGLAPHAAGAGEVEEPTRCVARAVLDEVVTVEHERLHAGEPGDVAVHVTPAVHALTPAASLAFC